METKLLDFKECLDNAHLFIEWKHGVDTDGPFVDLHTDGSPECFYWTYSGDLHRLNGPACIYYNGSVYWYFLGELVDVSNQNGFNKWMINNIMEV